MSRPMEMAYEYIKQRILDGTYHPSQKVTELELAEVVGVSRNTIKKALLKLEQENLVKIEKNKGAYVKSFTLEEVLNYLEIREVLEGLVAKTAAENISDADSRKDEERPGFDGKPSEEMKRFDEYSNLNKEFHNIIYQASRNVQAVEMINIIKNQLLRYHFRTILVPGRNKSSYKEHQNIFAALKARDPNQVETSDPAAYCQCAENRGGKFRFPDLARYVVWGAPFLFAGDQPRFFIAFFEHPEGSWRFMGYFFAYDGRHLLFGAELNFAAKGMERSRSGQRGADDRVHQLLVLGLGGVWAIYGIFHKVQLT